MPWQHQVYNLSCEEASLSMVMAFYGKTVTDQDVLNSVGVDLVHYWAGYDAKGQGGGDPYASFVGDPNGSETNNTGYGTYYPRISSAATSFGARVTQAGEGIAPATIYSAVRAGHPVQVWVTYGWGLHSRSDYMAFDGRSIPYAGPWEHSMVVTGISSTGIRVNDPDPISPSPGQYWISFATFEASFAVYNQMAVVYG